MNEIEQEALLMELRDDKLKREAIEKYKKEHRAFLKDVFLTGCALLGGVLGLIGFVRSF